MLTLSQATAQSRVILKWGGIILAVLIVIVLIFRGGTALKRTFFPAPPAPPTVSFGKLPLIIFPNNVSDKNFNYSLDTVTGALPAFPDRIKVYKMSPIPPDLLALKKAKNKVSSVGFTNPELSVSPKVYQWNSDDPLNRSITMDVFSADFALSSTFISDPVVISAKNLPNPQTAIGTAQDFLSSMSSFPGDIDTTKTKTLLFSINNNTLTSATSVSNSQVIEVDFFQKDINNLPIYYPKAVNSTMNVLVVGGKNQPQVAQVNFSHQSVSDKDATYPIKTAQEAYDLLKQGRGYIASYFGATTDISIKNVFLAYYIGDKKQQFLFPIAVFQGDNGFFAYVPVVTDEWTGN
ncbi:MAG: hypothetical protein M1405_00885 [Patescibacteria group bacterium]|nr:hypothetical protein [Patescibacteria group bacterium]